MTTKFLNLFFVLLLSTQQHGCSGFLLTPPSAIIASTKGSSSSSSNSQLHVGSVINETEDDARFIMSQAKQCAYGECSVSDAKVLLREILHVQSGCAAGTLVGHDVCEEQDLAADVVAHLRVKAQQGEGQDEKGDVAATNPLFLSSWIATADWPLVFVVLLGSTFLTLQEPHDEIVRRIGWALQNWDTVLEKKDEIPMLIFAAAPYVALSEFVGLVGSSATEL